MSTSLEGPATGGAPVPPPSSPYWSFYQRVAAAQLAEWLPHDPCRVLDLGAAPTSPSARTDQLLAAGHAVVSVVRGRAPRRLRVLTPELDLAPDGSLLPVRADASRLSWLRAECLDAVVAESRALSLCLAAEVTVADLHRVLRPGGRLLLSVDSLASGLARLAEQGRWAELADIPSADVVLVPEADGTIVRCFWPEELAALLTDAGFEVEWVRPRSVLSPGVVERALAEGGEDALRLLVRTECALAVEREGEANGLHLVVSAVRR